MEKKGDGGVLFRKGDIAEKDEWNFEKWGVNMSGFDKDIK